MHAQRTFWNRTEATFNEFKKARSREPQKCHLAKLAERLEVRLRSESFLDCHSAVVCHIAMPWLRSKDPFLNGRSTGQLKRVACLLFGMILEEHISCWEFENWGIRSNLAEQLQWLGSCQSWVATLVAHSFSKVISSILRPMFLGSASMSRTSTKGCSPKF